ncbi:MAG TPA: metalloregulator ArsR/SmtB family transcription factor [Dehalococcoidia bacterium]|nr:metalloregulator ArsR/SmtB family transcription factor [Dehalococcoidia bacterium]
MGEEQLQTMVRFFKALADESRLRLLGLLAGREASVEELATLLGLTAPTVSHHLARLRELGLVRMRSEGTTHLYTMDADALRRLSKETLEPGSVAALADDVEGEAWERKVLRDFFDGERLKEIPASRKKRLVVLRWLASQFRPDVRYPENEVNAILRRHHADAATLRRELVSDAYGLMQRERGVYWLTPPRESAVPDTRFLP